MISQNYKDFYFGILYICSFILRPLYSVHYFLFKRKHTKAHLGCGPNYLPGFINIDGNFNRRVDYVLDMRAGLPFPAYSMEFLYSCHFLEHLTIDDAMCVLKECARVLSPNGVFRITLPAFEHALAISEGSQPSEFPRKFSSSSGQAINFLFCDSQHRYAYSVESFKEIALACGFESAEEGAVNEDPRIAPLNEPEGSFVMFLKNTRQN